MSYDLYCFQTVANESPATTLDRLLEDADPGQPDPEIEVHKQAVVACLRRVNPKLEPFQLEHDKIAKLEGITIEQARSKYRYVELNTPETGFGIQLTVYDRYTCITVPFWHKTTEAEQAFREIWTYLTALHSEFYMVTYDPQLECILANESDLQRILASYLPVVEQLTKLGQPKRRWWKFW